VTAGGYPHRFTFTNSGGGTPPTAATRTQRFRIEVSLRAHHGRTPVARRSPTRRTLRSPHRSARPRRQAQAQCSITAGQLTIVPEAAGAGVGASANDVIFLLQLKNTGTQPGQPVIVAGSAQPLTTHPPFPAGGCQINFNGTPADTCTRAPTVDTTVSGQVTFTFGPQDYVAPGPTVLFEGGAHRQAGVARGHDRHQRHGITTAANTDLNGITFNCSPSNTGSTFNPPKKFCVDSETLTVKAGPWSDVTKEVRGPAAEHIVVPGPAPTRRFHLPTHAWRAPS
jgi:hypothetical protein